MDTERTTHPVNVNVRLTLEQHEYLQAIADDLNAGLSAAVRRAIDHARLFDMARENEDLRDAIRRGDTITDSETGQPVTLEDVAGFDFLRNVTVIDELADDDDDSARERPST